MERIVSIGTSYGGTVAMAHAARYPDSVSHLVLVCSAAHGGNLARARQILARRGTAEQGEQFEQLLAGKVDTPERMRNYFRVMGPLYSMKHDEALAKEAAERNIVSPEPLNRAFGPDGFLRRLDLRPQLAAIKAPTLVLAGRHDWICPPEFSAEIQSLIPGARLHVFEHAAHAIRADAPDEFRAVLADFLF